VSFCASSFARSDAESREGGSMVDDESAARAAMAKGSVSTSGRSRDLEDMSVTGKGGEG
jgi:hypothetical protein